MEVTAANARIVTIGLNGRSGSYLFVIRVLRFTLMVKRGP
jgi:hypothetical protein